MDTILGMELPLILKFVVSFAIVLALIGAAAFAVRKFGAKGLIPGVAPRGRQPRLAVIDTAQIDSRRSLVIVRRDNVEHLLLIGGPVDLVIESRMADAKAPPSLVQASDSQGIRAEPALAVPSVAPAATPAEALPVELPPPPIEPAQIEPEKSPEPRPELRAEPVLLPELRPDPEVRVAQVPPFVPASPQPAETNFEEVHPVPVEPRPPYAPYVPPVPTTVPPVPPVTATAAPVLDEPLARFAQDLDARRDQMNGQRPSAPPVQVALAPAEATIAPPAPPPPVRALEPAPSDEQNLADMAQRLEAALRRPLGANGTRSVPQPSPAPRVSATVSVRQPEPMRRTPGAAPPIPPQSAAARPAGQAAAAARAQASPDETTTYENLQREMANLLGRKPGSS